MIAILVVYLGKRSLSGLIKMVTANLIGKKVWPLARQWQLVEVKAKVAPSVVSGVAAVSAVNGAIVPVGGVPIAEGVPNEVSAPVVADNAVKAEKFVVEVIAEEENKL